MAKYKKVGSVDVYKKQKSNLWVWIVIGVIVFIVIANS